jgi:hypothetical protein
MIDVDVCCEVLCVAKGCMVCLIGRPSKGYEWRREEIPPQTHLSGRDQEGKWVQSKKEETTTFDAHSWLHPFDLKSVELAER